MPAGLVVPISGPYTGTFHALPIGTLSDDGYEMMCTIQGQEVNETDAYGMTLVEAIYRGQNWRIRMRGLEWTTGLLNIVQAFGSVIALPNQLLAPLLTRIGARWTDYTATLVLTAILGNPPTTPQSLTAANATYAPNYQTTYLKTSKVRELPLELVLLPYSTTVTSLTYNLPFTTT